jgi:CMP-N-acetylneuraminic acid synthetase
MDHGERMKLAALIPARSGSKRLPGKNMRDFFGHPLLAYAISAAVNSGIFDRVIVSSDDPQIGSAGSLYGAEFFRRPDHLASDNATLVDVARHALQKLSHDSALPEVLCQMMPNCPLVRSFDVRNHWRIFESGRRSFQISVVPYRGVYPHWALTADADFRGHWKFGQEQLVRSQDLQHTYCPTGAIWFVRAEDFLRQNAFYGEPFHLAPLDPNRGIDIDTLDDFEMAELLARGLASRDGASPLEPVQCGAFQHAGVSGD